MSDEAKSTTTSSESISGKQPKRKRIIRWTLTILTSLIVLMVLLVLMIPTLLGMHWGTSIFVNQINKRIPGKVNIDSLNLGWFSGQQIHGISLFDPDGQLILNVKEVQAPEFSLAKALLGSRQFGHIRVIHPTGTITQNPDGGSNLMRAISARKPVEISATAPPSTTVEEKTASAKPRKPFMPPATAVHAKIEVVDGQFAFNLPQASQFNVSGIQLTADLVDINRIQTQFQAIFTQDGNSGGVDAKVNLTNLIDGDGFLQPDKAIMDADIKLAHLPVVILSELAHRGNQLAVLLGPALNGSLQAKGPLEAPVTKLALDSTNLHALVGTAMQDNTLRAAPDSVLKLTVSPEIWAQLATAQASSTPSRLVQPFDAVMTLSKLSIPWNGSAADLAHAGLEVTLQIDDVMLDTPDPLGKVSLTHATANISTDELGKALKASFNTEINGSQGQGELRLEADVTNALTVDRAAHAKVEVGELSVALIDALLHTKNKIAVLLGSPVSLTLDGQYAHGQSDAVDLSINSPNVTTSFKGTIDRGLVLHLRENADVTLRITPEFANAYLAALDPVLTGVQSSQRPIQLTVLKEGFAAPLKNLTLPMVAADGKLELGTMTMHRSKSPIVELLILAMQAMGSPIANKEVFDATFTPLTFHVAGGVVNTNDLWMNTGDLVLGTQARVHQEPGRSQLEAEVAIGIPSETLGLIPQVVTDQGSVFELVAHGPINHIKPDYGQFFTRSILPRMGGKVGEEVGKAAEGVAEGIMSLIKRKKKHEKADSPENPQPSQTQKSPEPSQSDENWINHTWPNRPAAVNINPTPQPADQKARSDDSSSDADNGIPLIGKLFRHKKKPKAPDQAQPSSD